MASKSEDFVIELRDRVSGAARAAKSATSELAERMNAAREAAGALEGKLLAASTKLAQLTSAAGGVATEAQTNAIKRQEEAVAALQAQLNKKAGEIGSLESAQALAAEVTALDNARAAIEAEAGAVRELQSQLAILQSTETADQAAVASLTDAIERQKTAVLAAQQNFVKLGGSSKDAIGAAGGVGEAAKKLGDGGKEGESGVNAMLDAVSGSAGPMGGMIGRAKQLVGAIGKGGAAAALLAAAAAAVVFVVAIVAAAVALVKFAVASADAARSQRLITEGLAVTSESLADLGTLLPEVQRNTGLTADQIRGLAQQLDAAGVSAANMPEALNALATATAGGASAEFIKKLNDGLKATGHVLPELQGQMAKLGEIAQDKMRSLPALTERFHANLGSLFSGLKLDGFLKGLEKIVNLFDTSTASGKALKFLVEKLLQPLIDGATAAFPVIERGFLMGLVMALQFYIAVKKAQNALKDLGVTAQGAFGGGGGAGLDLGAAASAQTSTADAAKSGTDVGKSLADGLVAGMNAGAPAVAAAAAALGATAESALRAATQTHSPSKKFSKVARGWGEGLEQGAEDSVPAVNRAVVKMGDTPMPAPAVGGASGGTSYHFDLRGAVFGDGVDESKIRAWLRRAAESMRLSVEAPAS